MKKSLPHLPKHKRDELQRVKEIILDECPTVLMIVLFGSHARGDWVEDRHVEDGVLHEYMSDFDIIVIVRSNRIVNSKDTWRRAEARARRLVPHLDEPDRRIHRDGQQRPGSRPLLLHGHQERRHPPPRHRRIQARPSPQARSQGTPR